jgi:hypothetical protein
MLSLQNPNNMALSSLFFVFCSAPAPSRVFSCRKRLACKSLAHKLDNHTVFMESIRHAPGGYENILLVKRPVLRYEEPVSIPVTVENS